VAEIWFMVGVVAALGLIIRVVLWVRTRERPGGNGDPGYGGGAGDNGSGMDTGNGGGCLANPTGGR
jgi:hypothetical protein